LPFPVTLGGMWIPASADELERAARSGRLVEKKRFEAKREVGRNKDVAIDVNAMALDGGAVVYGIAEDANGRPTIPAPIELAGQRERIDQVVNSSCAEPPEIDIHELPRATDPSRGYLFVEVPASAHAPQQVTTGGAMRYYGRTATGNKILTDEELGRYLRRRAQAETDREALLAEAVARAPVPRDPNLGYLHAFVRPALPDASLLERALGANERELRTARVRAAERPGVRYGVTSLHGLDWRWHGADGLALRSAETDERPRTLVIAEIAGDGAMHLFCGRAAERSQSAFFLFDGIIAGNLTAFLAVAGTLYEAASYSGPVDLGVALTGIEGATSHLLYFQYACEVEFARPEYRATTRVPIAEIVRDPTSVARRLLDRFFRVALRGRFDPFTGQTAA
jgi:hypothetical protein